MKSRNDSIIFVVYRLSEPGHVGTQGCPGNLSRLPDARVVFALERPCVYVQGKEKGVAQLLRLGRLAKGVQERHIRGRLQEAAEEHADKGNEGLVRPMQINTLNKQIRKRRTRENEAEP